MHRIIECGLRRVLWVEYLTPRKEHRSIEIPILQEREPQALALKIRVYEQTVLRAKEYDSYIGTFHTLLA